MNDLIAFLRERLDEQEARARALPSGPWEWKTVEDDPQYDKLAGPSGESILASSDTENYCSWITRHDAFDAYLQDIQTARALAKVEADRRILALHEPVILHAGGGAAHFDTTRVCRSCEPPKQFPETAYPCATLRLLASVYDDHLDYKPEWRP